MTALSSTVPTAGSPADVRLTILNAERPKTPQSRVIADDSVIVKIDMERVNRLLGNLSNPKGTPLSEAHIEKLNLLNEKIFGSSQCCEKAKLINLATAVILGFTAGLPCFFNDDPTLGFFITGVVGMVSYLFFEHMNRKGQREMMRALIEKNNLYTELTRNSMTNAIEILNAHQCDIVALTILNSNSTYASDLNLLEPVIYEKDATSELAIGGRAKKFRDSLQAFEKNFANLETSIVKYDVEQDQAEKILEPLVAVIAIINGKEYLGPSASILKEHKATVLNERLKFLINTLKARRANEMQRLSFSTKPMIGGRVVIGRPPSPSIPRSLSPDIDRKLIETDSSNSSNSDSPSPPRTPPLALTHLEQVIPQFSENSLTPPKTGTLLKPLGDRTRRHRGPIRAFTDIVPHISAAPLNTAPLNTAPLNIVTPNNLV